MVRFPFMKLFVLVLLYLESDMKALKGSEGPENDKRTLKTGPERSHRNPGGLRTT